MSTSVSDHQRGKGPGNSGKPPSKFSNNASKGGDYEEVDSWRNQAQQQHHQGYGQANDPYMSYGYGAFPYQAQPPQQQQQQAPFVNENGPWSNGGDVGFLGGGNYASQGMHDSQGGQGHYGGDAMFSGGAGGNGGYNNFGGGGGGGPGFGYGGYNNGGDYSTWGGPQPRKHYDDYYGGSRDGMYGDERSVKMMEQGMGGLSLRGDGGSDDEMMQGGGGSKKTTWASIASQPAKPTTIMKKKPGMPPPPIIPGAWESKNGAVAKAPIAAPVQAPHPPPAWERPKIPPPQPGPPPQQQPPPQSAPMDRMERVERDRGNRDIREIRERDPRDSRDGRDGGRDNRDSRDGRDGRDNRDMRDIGPRGGNDRDRYQDPPMGGGRGGYMPKHSQGYGRPPPDQHPPHNSYSHQQPPSHPPSHPPPPPQSHPSNNSNNNSVSPPPPPVVTAEKLSTKKNDYNPGTFDLSAEDARFFVIKSYSEDDIHRSIKYEIWCSTEHGNRRLNDAWKERDGKGPIFLFFSVNGSGHFCGMAQMISHVDYNASSSVWAQDKWKGQFKVKWVYVKDVPNQQLRNIRLENNENKPVTNSRDTQEVPHDKGKQVLKIIHTYPHTTSIFDDFTHYEKRQEEEDQRRTVVQHQPSGPQSVNDRFDHGGPGGPGGYGGGGGRGRGGYQGGNHYANMDRSEGQHGGGHFGGGRGGGRDRDFGGGGGGRGGDNHRDFRDHGDRDNRGGDRMDNRNYENHRGGGGGGMDRMERGGGNHFNGRGDGGGHRDFYQRDRGEYTPRGGGMRGGGRGGGHHHMRE